MTGPTPPPASRPPMSRAEVDRLTDLTLTEEQWECVSAPLEPFVIVAGAGTGKTAVMAARVLWLVGSGLVAEHEVLGLTFTNKAAAELAHRVTTLLGRWRAEQPPDRYAETGEPTVTTYHSFARRLIDEQGLRVGIEPGARLLSAAADAQLAYRVVCAAEGLHANHPGPTKVASDVLRLDANLAEQTITTAELRAHDRSVIAAIDELPRTTKPVRDIRSTAERRIELADLVDQLRAERVRVGGLDFSDHMRLCVDLVRGSGELVAQMRQTYRAVLLDEYQDTSIAQRVILSTLFAGTGVTAVGDPLQAIYGWRSASVANIAAFPVHFGADPDDEYARRVLSVNRRSGDPILAAANRVAADLREAHPEVAVLRSPAPRDAEVRAALLPTIADEREWVADQIAALVADGRPPEQIAVLARANDDLGPIRDALELRGIPASISGAAAIAASAYAMQVLATLRVLNDPADNTSLAALLAGPRWRLGSQDLEQLGRRADHLAGGPAARRARRSDPMQPQPSGPNGLRERLAEAGSTPDPVEQPSLLEAAADPGARISDEGRARLAQFVAEIRHLQGRVAEPLADLTARVVHVTGAQVESDLRARATHAATLAAGSGTRASGSAPATTGSGTSPAGSTSAGSASAATVSGADSSASGSRSGSGAAASDSSSAASDSGETPSPVLLGDVGLSGLLQLVDGFHDADGRSGLGAFLAYLDAADQLGASEQVDLPVVPGAVQLMTMHKAKGLQFPVVVLPHVAEKVFPGGQGSDRWTTQAHVVPIDLRDDRHVLPRLRGYAKADLDGFLEACRAHDRSGDDRLAYVAVTRAQDVLIASAHWWGATQKGRRGPSPYLQALREQSAEAVEQLFVVGAPWAEEPTGDGDGEPTNPLLEQSHEVPWPVPDPAADDPAVRAARSVRALLDAGVTPRPWESDSSAWTASGPPRPAADARPGSPGGPPEGGFVEPAIASAADVNPARTQGRPDASVGPPAGDALPADARALPAYAGALPVDAGALPVDVELLADVAALVAEWDAAIASLLARSGGPGDLPAVRVPGVMSASATMELAADADAFAERLVRPMPRRRNRFADLGTAFHAWVEARLGVQPLIADDELPGAADEGIETAEELAELKESFERLPYAARQPVGLEVPFSLAVGGRLVRGRIDAVFPAGPDAPEGQLWEVVDWKTSARDEADPLQLAIYREAWAQMRGVPVESVGAAFVFVRSGTVLRPDGLPDAEGIAALIGAGGMDPDASATAEPNRDGDGATHADHA